MSEAIPAYDALFVVNQNCDLQALCSFCRKRGHARVFLLTTHALFLNELEILRAGLPVEPDIRTFADYLNDREMEKCDEEATAELLAQYGRTGTVRDGYNARFMALTLDNKNKSVQQRLFETATFGSVYYAPGLGITGGAWRSSGGTLLPPPVCTSEAGSRLLTVIERVIGKVRALACKRVLQIVDNGTREFIFLSSIRRLRLSMKPQSVEINPIAGRLKKALNSCIVGRERQTGKEGVLATTIHEYEGWMARLGRPLYVFIDGHHPTNYPRTYIDAFETDDFVTRTMIDGRWFELHGKRAHPPASFLEIEYFKKIVEVSTVNTVVLLLNHAGDWTSLINRSDTDVLIQAFVGAASAYPQQKFIIRPHPTMVHPQHEGEKSIDRIRGYVAWTGLANLEVSSTSLDEDFERGDLFVSEYSQTLLDVYRIGKPGLIANCTGRRSFMADFEELGFPAMSPSATLTGALAGVFADVSRFVAMQNAGVRSYNKALSSYVTGRASL